MISQPPPPNISEKVRVISLAKVAAVLLLATGLWCGSAGAAMTHYVVLNLANPATAQFAPAVSYYQLLDLPRRPAVSQPATRWRNALVAVDQNDAVLAAVSTAVHHSDEGPTTVVLRIPVVTENISVQHWDDGASMANRWPLQQLIDAAQERGATAKGAPADDDPPLNRVNLLMLSEGYTATEEEKFNQDVARALEGFFAIEPYRSYRAFIAVESFFVPSAESGADHPGCLDVDPVAPLAVDTVFDATFCTADVDRLLTVNENAVARVAAQAPFFWDRAAVVVNDDRYGGSGGFFPVISTHPLSPELLIHEWGHSFTLLTDEYVADVQPSPCSDRNLTLPPCEPNATDETDRSRIKWRRWIDPSVAVPTPVNVANQDVVGLFEGARYQQRGMYRPIQQCAMRSLGRDFCPVCSQTYVSTLYDGGWGLPAGGVSLIEPDSASPPAGALLKVATGEEVVLSAQIVLPDHGVKTIWSIDGQPTAEPASSSPIDGATNTKASFIFRPAKPGQFEVTLEVTDRSPFLAGALNTQQRTFRQNWTVEATGIAISGLWFDPANPGDGFNVIVADGTTTVFFFGYATDGSRLWLVSNSIDGTVVANQPVQLEMAVGPEGTFKLPGAPESLTVWGSLEMTLDDCNGGTFTLDGDDGRKELNVVRLAGVGPQEC